MIAEPGEPQSPTCPGGPAASDSRHVDFVVSPSSWHAELPVPCLYTRATTLQERWDDLRTQVDAMLRHLLYRNLLG